MNFIKPPILFALLTLAGIFLFLARYALSLQTPLLAYLQSRRSRKGGRPQKPPQSLSFAGTCHPMERKDRLPILLITLVYALTAFFQLGDMDTPRRFVDFKDRPAVTVRLHGTADSSGTTVYVTGLRYYPGLGTGSYNVEVSSDGEHWSTLWQRKDPTGYYFADAADYAPSYALEQSYNQLYKWQDIKVENPQNVQFIRISGKADKEVLELGKLCLLGQDGQVIHILYGLTDTPYTDVTEIDHDLLELFNADSVPEKSTWHNSTYFDEIYHARTAKEHIDGIYPYEITHPPLGKLILGLGIRLFGMTPFGWRFSGTLFGVLMLPILYVFLKNMFGKTAVAACGTILFATDFMHLTQTRIATIDTYAVFFILCMYFFMYRYLTLPAGTSFRKGALPLFLSGLTWALGAASKWTVFYAGVGLAVLYFMGLYQKLRDWPQDDLSVAQRTSWLIQTLLFSVLCFVILPFVIYCAAYIPYAQAQGVDLFAHSDQDGLALLVQNVWGKLTFTGEGSFNGEYIPPDNLLNIMAGNQWYMFNYHSGVTQSHPYSSWWFQWLVNARPILYYMDNTVAGFTTRFGAFANPVLCWTGLAAILICAAHSFRRLWAKGVFLAGMGLFAGVVTYKVQHTPNGVFDPTLSPQVLSRNLLILVLCLLAYLLLCALILRLLPGYSEKAAFLLVGYLSQLAPWMFVGRTTFEYHYFPSLLFLVLSVSYLFNDLIDHDSEWRTPVYSLTGLSAGLYLLFYPVLTGLTIPTWYEPLVKWIESWPF